LIPNGVPGRRSIGPRIIDLSDVPSWTRPVVTWLAAPVRSTRKGKRTLIGAPPEPPSRAAD
jgi:hypothetical protein